MKTQSALVLVLLFVLFSLTLEKKIKSKQENPIVCSCTYIFNKGKTIEFTSPTWWVKGRGNCTWDGCVNQGTQDKLNTIISNIADKNQQNLEYYTLKGLNYAFKYVAKN